MEETIMSMKTNHQLPLPEVLKQEYPLSKELQKAKLLRDQEIRRIFTGESDKFVVLVGPCSADNEDTVCEYVNRLKKVADKVSDKLMIIPRVYTNKPRTTGDGYKGMLHQPDPDKAPDLLAGIIAIRKMHIRVLEETGLSSADEMLYPENRSYLDDVLSYEAIGARSVENQQHRLTASGMDIPVGMKNPTSGDLSVMLNSVIAAQHPHHFIYRGCDVETVCEYVNRLKKVADKVSDKLMIIPRVYTNKPRTTGDGYKGMLHQPDPDKAPDLLAGIIAIRKMHIRVLEETGLSSADEMLYPENRSYLDDVLSYEAIGARSVENQQHRLTASGMDIPVGMKNPTSGDLSVMLNSVIAAQHPHHFIYRGCDVETSGNELAHTILRGGVNKYGQTIPNYHYEDLMRLYDLYGKKNLKNPAAIVDVNHSNSGKQFKEQIRIVSEVLHSRNYNPDLRKLIKGVMIESYLLEGRQDISDHMTPGCSITDPCLGWEDTERLIYEIAEKC